MRPSLIVACVINIVLSCRERPTTVKPLECPSIEIANTSHTQSGQYVRPTNNQTAADFCFTKQWDGGHSYITIILAESKSPLRITKNGTDTIISCEAASETNEIYIYLDVERYLDPTKLDTTFIDYHGEFRKTKVSLTSKCDETLKQYVWDFSGRGSSEPLLAIKRVWCIESNPMVTFSIQRLLQQGKCEPPPVFESNHVDGDTIFIKPVTQEVTGGYDIGCPRLNGYTIDAKYAVEQYLNNNLTEKSISKLPPAGSTLEVMCINAYGRNGYGMYQPIAGMSWFYTNFTCLATKIPARRSAQLRELL